MKLNSLATAVTPLFFTRISLTWRAAGIFPCFRCREFRVHGNAQCAAALFNQIAASKLRRDLPARRTKGYKAFANDMIRELFRVPPLYSAHPRHTQGTRIFTRLSESRYSGKKKSYIFICILLILFFYWKLLKRTFRFITSMAKYMINNHYL